MDAEQKKLRIQADPSHVLMSDVLRGQIPALEGEGSTDQLDGKHVVVVAQKVVGQKTEGLIGILRGALLGTDPEIELRIDLKEALEIIRAPGLSFTGFELHHGEDLVIPIPGPFIVRAARIDEISAQDQLCTLGLHLVKQVR